MKALSNIAELWYLYIIFSWGVWYLISDIFKALVVVFKYTSNQLEKRLVRKDDVVEMLLQIISERESLLSSRIDSLENKILLLSKRTPIVDEDFKREYIPSTLESKESKI